MQQPRAKSQRQITVRRFGWSNASQAEAEQMARQRAQESLTRLVAGESLPRHEPRKGYNGAAGVPIREEILEQHGDVVITRNSYGARCLNTPDVVFADIDFSSAPRLRTVLLHGAVLVVAAALISAWLHSGLAVFISALVVLLGTYPFAIATHQLLLRLRGGPEKAAMARLRSFLSRHPDWHLRLYRTPAGFRVLVMHSPYTAGDPRVREFFAALGVDPVYARMCLHQDCFRARVSPKPWRIGITGHLRPRPGLWPVHPDRLPLRQAWVSNYERIANRYASCRFLESLGSGTGHPQTEAVRQLHDHAAQALSQREIA